MVQTNIQQPKVRILKKFIYIILFVLLLFATYFYLRVFVFDFESRNFELNDEMSQIAAELENYKNTYSKYPDTLKEIEKERICSKKIINFCVDVKYNVVENGKGFRLAAKSLSWPILYYHSDLSKGTIYTRFAYPQRMRNSYKAINNIPIYKETSPIFAHPDEWPNM